ncbi:MAG TPA: glycosyltransferase family 2 protein [bacterium]|nr:glycosyltransferase family 2 protein [bacterium]HPV65553.1 glycosyltransferase family 2 protein [bacterium]
MDLSIVIVNYKSREKTKKCLESILLSDLSSLSWEIILVDNDSGDNLDGLLDGFNNFKLIKSEKNLGMGGGNNLGIKVAEGDFVLILNPDTELEPSAVKTMLDYIRSNNDVYIVGPKLLNPDLSLQYSCSYFPRPWTPIFRRTFLGNFFKKHLDWFLMKDFDHNYIKEVDWLMGSCLLIRKNGFDGFDERFFMYFEDIDVCRRAWHFGKRVVYLPEAKVIHHHARESAKKPWYLGIVKSKLTREHIKSWFKYFIKWGLKK